MKILGGTLPCLLPICRERAMLAYRHCCLISFHASSADGLALKDLKAGKHPIHELIFGSLLGSWYLRITYITLHPSHASLATSLLSVPSPILRDTCSNNMNRKLMLWCGKSCPQDRTGDLILVTPWEGITSA